MSTHSFVNPTLVSTPRSHGNRESATECPLRPVLVPLTVLSAFIICLSLHTLFCTALTRAVPGEKKYTVYRLVSPNRSKPDMEKAETSGACSVSFNATEASENGGWIRGDQAERNGDPPRCLQNCREQFLGKVASEYDNDFTHACKSLTKDGPNQDLWPLYWCDSAFCGVYIDEKGPVGQDRES